MRWFRSVSIACVLALVIVGLLVTGVWALTINKLEMVPCAGQTVTYTSYGINYPSGAEMVCVEFDIVHANNEVLDERISDASGHVWREGSFLTCPASQCHSWGQFGYCAYGCPANGRVWPNGFYHFDLLLNGELTRSLPFSVGVTVTPTPTATPTATATDTPTATNTPTNTPTATSTPTNTPTLTDTPTPTPTGTPYRLYLPIITKNYTS